MSLGEGNPNSAFGNSLGPQVCPTCHTCPTCGRTQYPQYNILPFVQPTYVYDPQTLPVVVNT